MSRRAWGFDIAVAALVFVLGQLEAWWGIGASHRQGPLWVQSLLYGVTALLLVFRRVHPMPVLAAMVALFVVEFVAVGSPEGNGVALAPLIAIYTVGRYVEPRRAWLGLALGVVLWTAWMAFDPRNDSWPERVGTAVWLGPWVIAWLVGALVRMTAMYREQRRAARGLRASRAVAEERNRIARELHDVIGHSVSVMTVQAGAVRRRLHPDQSVEREALETVENVGREALAEMRRMVGVLRRGEADPVARPGAATRARAGRAPRRQVPGSRAAGLGVGHRALPRARSRPRPHGVPDRAGGSDQHPSACAEPALRRGHDRLPRCRARAGRP